MKNLTKSALASAAILAAGSLWVGDLGAHGGTYRGPGDTVPPGAGGGGGGAGTGGTTGAPSTGDSPVGPATGGAIGPAGSSPGAAITPGGTVSGSICIGGSGVVYGRHSGADQLFTTDGSGAASLTIDANDLQNPRNGISWPAPGNNTTAILAGETFYWQAWYRITGGSEFSDATGITFR